MATQRYGFNTTYIDGATEYTGPEIARLHRITDTQLGGAIEAFGTGVIKDPNDDSLLVEAVSGLDIKINPGRGFSRHSTYGGFWFQLTSTLNITGLAPNSTHYILAGLLTGESDGETIDTRETGTPSILVSSTDTVDGALLLAEVVTGPSSVLSVTDLRNFVTLGDGPAVPTGTGFVHISSGVQDAAAKLVSNADVAADAAIAESKLSLASDAPAGTPSRRTLGTGATQAAAGNHSHSNATTTVAGFMSGTDKSKLDGSTANATALMLMMRDANGRAQVAEPSSSSDIATKNYVDETAASGAADADETTKGITMLSVAPESDPVAVGDNDPRVAPFVASGASHTAGLVPDPGATPGSSKFLREDATWATPPTGTLAVQEDGEPAVNSVDTVVIDGAIVTDNEDGSVTLAITPASVGAAEAVHTHDISDVTGLQTALDGKAPASAALPTGGTTGQVLAKTSGTNYAVAWIDPPEGGGGTGTGIEPIAVAQEAHGFSVGDHIRVTGNDTYTLAQADSASNAEIAGRVATVADVDNFSYLPIGPIVTGSGWTAGEVRFLDPTTPGADTATPPETPGDVVRAVLLPINAAQAIQVPDPGYVVPTPDDGDADTLNGEAGSYYLNRTNHTGTQAISTVTGLQTALDGLTDASLPSGGTTGQVLAKSSGTNYDVGWVAPNNLYMGCRLTTGTSQTFSNNTPSNVAFDSATVSNDSNGFYNPISPHKLTVPIGCAGWYLIKAWISFNTNANGYRQLSIHASLDSLSTKIDMPGSSENGYIVAQGFAYLSEGSEITCSARQTSGGDLATIGGGNAYSAGMQIIRIAI